MEEQEIKVVSVSGVSLAKLGISNFIPKIVFHHYIYVEIYTCINIPTHLSNMAPLGHLGVFLQTGG